MNDLPGRPSEAEAEAAVWLARLHADDRSPRDEKAFRQWLAIPANEAAFAELTSAWDLAGGVQRNPYEVASQPPRIGRRELVFGATALVAVMAGTGYWNAAIAGVYETELGEQKRVNLSDGSLLILDTDSKVRVRVGDGDRRVELLRGRCNVRVAPNGASPFVMAAGDRALVSPKGSFDLRRDDGRVQLLCIDGAARVAAAGNEKAASGAIKAGEQLVAPTGATPRIEPADVNAAAAWQMGQLIFQDQTLAEAAAEMNRYSTEKLVVNDPRAASLRLSGVYRSGDNAAFARSVAQLLPIRAEQSGEIIRLTLGPESG